MTDWQPVAELESLLDALEAELLSATDEEISDALGHRRPARLAALGVVDGVKLSDTMGWRHGAGGQEIASPSARNDGAPSARNDVVRLS